MFSKISISAIGKTTKEFQEIENNYLKQIKTKISMQIHNHLSYLSKEEQIEKESLQLQKDKSNSEWTVLLDKDGIQLSSEDFTKKLNDWTSSAKIIRFIIGGSYGVSEELKKSSNFILSFSKATFPHQLARIILLEQIYRSETILSGSKYHK